MDSFWGYKLPWLRMSGGVPPLLLCALKAWTGITLRLLRSFIKMHRYIPSLVKIRQQYQTLYSITHILSVCTSGITG